MKKPTIYDVEHTDVRIESFTKDGIEGQEIVTYTIKLKDGYMFDDGSTEKSDYSLGFLDQWIETIQTEVNAKKELWDSINNIEDFAGLDYDSSGRFMEDGEYTTCWGFSSIDELNRFLSTDWTEFLQQADVDIYSHPLWLDATPTFNDYN